MLEREAREAGTIDEHGHPTAARVEAEDDWWNEASPPARKVEDDEDPPF